MSVLLQQQLMMAAAVPAVTQTTWDPANKSSDIVLSAGNTIASTTVNSNGGSVRSVTAHNSGKFYVELKCTQISTSWATVVAGLGDAAMSLLHFPGYDADGWGASAEGGSGTTRVTYHNLVGANSAVAATNASGQTMRLAIDISAGSIWLAHWGNATWLGGGDPAAGTSPTYTFPPGTAMYLAANPNGGASSTPNQIKLVDPALWSNSAPAGFGVWT